MLVHHVWFCDLFLHMAAFHLNLWLREPFLNRVFFPTILMTARRFVFRKNAPFNYAARRIVGVGLMFYSDSFFLFRFASYSRASLKETQPNFATRSEVRQSWKYLSKIWDIPPVKLGAKVPIFGVFRRLRDSAANLTANLWNQTWYRNRRTALKTRKGPLQCPKILWALVHKRPKMGPEILHDLRKFCILLHCQTEVSERNLTTLRQSDGKG